jgi:ER-derived vesicles protein
LLLFWKILCELCRNGLTKYHIFEDIKVCLIDLEFPWGLAELFLSVNVTVMLIGSVFAIAKKRTDIAVAGLGGVIISQWIGYGLVFDTNFLLRNLSVAGGLLMLLADFYASNRKKLFAGLPTLNETDKSMYLQLFGRILLVFLFLTFVFSGEFSILRVFVSVIGLIGCVMVVIGFKAKYTAWMLITILSISNVVLNNWWSVHHAHPRRYFLLTQGFLEI